MKQTHLRHEVVEFIPERLEDGVLYVSYQYKTAVHRCCCGCGEEVVTPLNPTDWSIEIGQRGVTLHPSIGNWSYACRSHYWIRSGKVVWAGRMTQREIERGRTRDRANKEQYFDEINRFKGSPAPAEGGSDQKRPGILRRYWSAFVQWWNS